MEETILKMVGFDLQVPCLHKYYEIYIENSDFFNNEGRDKILFLLELKLLEGKERKVIKNIFWDIVAFC